MSGSLSIVPLTTAKAAIARGFLEGRSAFLDAGHVILKPHQVAAAALLRQSIEEFGGAVLCDPVGTGKTFTALALAPANGLTLVIAPAVLRSMWFRATATACRHIEFVSFESLSRSTGPKQSSFDFVIVDEAHHIRNPLTARYRLLSECTNGARVVMLTATPIHNRRKDLLSLLRIFMGERSEDLSDAELGRCVIRREQIAKSLDIPYVNRPIWHRLTEDETIPTLLLALPPPIPPSDGGDGGALVIHSLVRQWASSNAALESALRRRLLQSSALIAALEDGMWPTRTELSSWLGCDGAIQLGFTSLLASVNQKSAQVLPAVVAHRDGVRDVLASLRASHCNDDERASLIRNIRSQHPGQRIVAFSAYADTVHAMFTRLAHDGRVAALTGNGARVAGGRVSRREAIDRFAPKASGALEPARAEEVTLLITTDLLSEGVNLQDASVVIHLDLPWTPARMEQRVGRLARIGSSHSQVVSHAIHPPLSADMLVRIESILDEKRLTATTTSSAMQYLEVIESFLRSWYSSAPPFAGITAAAVRSDRDGFVALCIRSGVPVLVVAVNGNISDSPETVLDCLYKCEASETHLTVDEVQRHVTTLSDWLSATIALGDIRTTPRAGGIRDSVARRISAIISSARTHERAEVSRLATEARAALQDRISEFVERTVDRHMTAESSDLEWLRSLLVILRSRRARKMSDPYEIRVMIIQQQEMR